MALGHYHHCTNLFSAVDPRSSLRYFLFWIDSIHTDVSRYRGIRILALNDKSSDDSTLHYRRPYLRLGWHQTPSRSCESHSPTNIHARDQRAFFLYQGLSNFHDGQAFVGGFSAFAQTFVFAFYSFGGIELVAIAAGESAKPYKSVPKAIKATFFRIVIFYILTILTIGLCVNHGDDSLLTAATGESFYVK